MTLEIFEYLEKYDYEQVVFCQDKESGLKAIIAIHDTTLGPALGGTRMWTYDSEEAAIEDALRLAKRDDIQKRSSWFKLRWCENSNYR